MDNFQYKVYSDKWSGLTTNKQREMFIREMHNTLATYTWTSTQVQPVPEDVNKVKLLRNCIKDFNHNNLPDYLLATVYLLRIKNE